MPQSACPTRSCSSSKHSTCVEAPAPGRAVLRDLTGRARLSTRPGSSSPSQTGESLDQMARAPRLSPGTSERSRGGLDLELAPKSSVLGVRARRWPCGRAAGRELARAGLRTVLIDRSTYPSETRSTHVFQTKVFSARYLSVCSTTSLSWRNPSSFAPMNPADRAQRHRRVNGVVGEVIDDEARVSPFPRRERAAYELVVERPIRFSPFALVRCPASPQRASTHPSCLPRTGIGPHSSARSYPRRAWRTSHERASCRK